MMTILFLSCVTAFILLMWFKTEVVVEWAGLLGFKKLCGDFNDAKIEVAPSPLSYPQYLKLRRNSFVTRLISCPFCLSVWLVAYQCFGLALLFSNMMFVFYYPIVYFLSLFIYGVTVKLYNITL